MAYTLDPVETPNAADDVVSAHGVNVYVDPKAVLFLLGSTMDFETTKLRSGFVFQNPNEVSACGCGELVLPQARQRARARRGAESRGPPMASLFARLKTDAAEEWWAYIDA